MSEYDYVKVLLYAYPQLPAFAEAIGVSVENRAALSFRSVKDTLSIAEELATELGRKVRLMNVCEKLDRILLRLTEEEAFLLEYKYFRRKRQLREKFSEWAFDCSERSYYRKQTALLRKIAARLIACGETEERFLEEFSDCAPLMRLYRALKAGKERTFVAKREKSALSFGQKSEGSSRGGVGDFFPRRTKTAIATTDAQARQMRKMRTPDSDCRADSFSESAAPEAGTR